MEEREAVFVSYAWGERMEQKEWLREDVVRPLLNEFDVFWDRDSISFGQVVDAVIARELNRRPLTIFCLVDEAYLASANRQGSGLYRELAMIGKLDIADSVRLIPIILDANCKQALPQQLSGRAYLDLSSIHSRGLRLGPVLFEVACGASQAQVAMHLTNTTRVADVREAAFAYFSDRPQKLYGKASTHEVMDIRQQLLLPPRWMWERIEWSRMLHDEEETFWPTRGIWHWDHWTPSKGMRALGTAALACFFPQRSSVEDCEMFEQGGIILAERVFRFTKRTEAFILDHDDILNVMLPSDQGLSIMEHLLFS